MNTPDLVEQLRAKCCCSQVEGCGKCLECTAADALVQYWEWETKVCQWSDADACWDTSCGECYTLITGTPESNGLKFCPFCGAHLVVVSGGEK